MPAHPSLSTLLTLLALVTTFPALSASVRVPVIADTSLQLHPQEITCNSGGSSAIRIKGIEHYMLVKFDLAPIRRWRVEKATLHLHKASPCRLRTMGLSTIAADWQEGTGRSSETPGGCTFTRAIWPDTFWAGPGSDFLDVALTNGNTLVRYADIHEEEGDWFAVDVAPELVQAMLCGGSFGLCLTDEKGQTRANNDVHSREQNASAPYMIVEGAPVSEVPPAEVRIIAAEPCPQAASFESGAASLIVNADHATRFEIAYREDTADRQLLPLYLTPWPKPDGGEQAVVIPGLRPEAAYMVEVTPVGPLGDRGSAVRVRVSASPAKPLPTPLPKLAMAPPPPGRPIEAAGLAAWACPAECKVHPVTGNVLEEVGREAYSGPATGRWRTVNPAWSAAGASVSGGRGEVVALQVVVEGAVGSDRQVAVQFVPSAETPAPMPVGLYRVWYVKDGDWFAEYMVPVGGRGARALDAARTRDSLDDQRNQAFILVWEIPRDAKPSALRGTFRVTAQDAPDQPLDVPVTLYVRDLELPAKTTFEVDLNCYGQVCAQPTWDKYLEWERKYYAAAHALRCTLNPLGYSHSGRVDFGWAPKLEGEGAGIRVTDWSDFDRHFGPYLDGSAFGGVRAGVPVSHIYLPFHENWPTPIAGHYTGGNDLRQYPENIAVHAMQAPPVEQAFDRTFRDAFVAVARQFAEHARERGWTQTDLQCYQNNKYYYKDAASNFRGTSWWLLDEPMHRDDWLALRYFARLFKEGVAEAPHMVYRGDISRPQFQRDWLDGLADLMCVSSELFAHNRHLRAMKERWPVTFWHYGTANAVSASNLAGEAWALKAYCAGADGILPWNCIGGDTALDQPTDTALFVPGTRFGIEGPVLSMRLLGLCRGQQDVEYLNLLAGKKGYDRDQVARLVSDFLALGGTHTGRYAEDAGVLVFDGLQYGAFEALRRAVAVELARG